MFVPLWVLVALGLVVVLAVTGLWRPALVSTAGIASLAFALLSAPFVFAWSLLATACSVAWWAVTHPEDMLASTTAPGRAAAPRSGSAPPR